MKVMIGVDMEGITGITNRDFTTAGARMYAEGTRLAEGDVNATIEGLLDAGADQIVVWDAHSSGCNLSIGNIHPAAQFQRGSGANAVRWPGLDDSFAGLILLGYHAMAGTLHAVLEHTMSSASWFRIAVNERPIGELAYDAALAGAVGVPVIMTSGCDKLCAEAAEFLGPDVVAICVKQGMARHTARCLSPAETAKLLRAGAAEAVGKLGKVKPLDLGSPAVVEMTYKHTENADRADLRKFAGRRIDGYTVRWTARDFPTWAGFTTADPPPVGDE